MLGVDVLAQPLASRDMLRMGVDEAIAGVKQELKAAGRPEPIFQPDTSDFQDVLAEINRLRMGARTTAHTPPDA